MSFLFGGTPPTLSELTQRYRTKIARSTRELDGETRKLQAQEKSLMVEIRRCAAANPSMARQKALSVVRTRKMAARFSNMQSQLQEVSARILNLKSTASLETALASSNQAIRTFVNRCDSGKTLTQTLRDFEKNCNVMSMQNELTDDILDTAFDDEHEEEAGSVIEMILYEAGVADIPGPPKTKEINLDDLDMRLSRLKAAAR